MSSKLITSARMKPRSISVCIFPAATGASVPSGTGQALTSAEAEQENEEVFRKLKEAQGTG